MKYAGTLKGKIVMTWSDAKLTPSFRQMVIVLPILSWKKWQKLNFVQPQQGGGNATTRKQPRNQFMLQRRMNEMINKEKPALVFTMTARGK